MITAARTEDPTLGLIALSEAIAEGLSSAVSNFSFSSPLPGSGTSNIMDVYPGAGLFPFVVDLVEQAVRKTKFVETLTDTVEGVLEGETIKLDNGEVFRLSDLGPDFSRVRFILPHDA